MSNELDIPFERITYRDGQLLTARDLRDERRRNDRLRRLHTRYLHNTWGIALGFKVHQSRDNRFVVVAPGYAIDGAGGDILLAEGVRLPVPDMVGPQALVLTLSCQDETAFHGRPDSEGSCLRGGLDPRQQRPLFAWLPPEKVRFGPQVPLLQVTVAHGAIQGGLNFRVRRNATSLARSPVSSGSTEPGRTGWRYWEHHAQSGLGPAVTRLGLEVTVDTSAAGFSKTPRYLPFLLGDFGSSLFPSAFSFITAANSVGFTYRIIRADHLPFGTTISPDEAESRRWTISWVGIEPIVGREPALNLARIFALSGFSVLEAGIS
jgi:hypothetical protein